MITRVKQIGKGGKGMHLEIKNLYKSFGDTQVLHGISFEVESGKALGFLGRNGAGKTTTLRILMNLFKQNQGEILLDGKPFKVQEHQIGYLPEERGLYPKKKVIEQLVYFGELRGLGRKKAKENADIWLERLGVTQYRNKKLESLSKGNQQKVQLAETFICDPEIVVLDEPFSGLDPVNAQILKDIIREQIEKKKLVIFSSHQMGYIEEFCKDIALIHHGKVVLQGNLKDIKGNYGMNRLTLKDGKRSMEELKQLLQGEMSSMLQSVETAKEQLIIELQPGRDKREFLQRALDLDLDIEGFGLYEPTLEDIFVEKAGDIA